MNLIGVVEDDRDAFFRAESGPKKSSYCTPVRAWHRLHSLANVSFRKIFPTLAVVVSLIFGGISARAADPVVTESQIKAAFLLNFPKYVEWPADAFAASNSPLVVAIFGDEAVSADFQRLAEGKSIGGHPVEFRAATTPEACVHCHMLFLGTIEPREIADILNRVRDTSVLTVGETDEFLDKGGVINLSQRDRKIRVDISLRAARQANLRISSKLLSIADNVRGK